MGNVMISIQHLNKTFRSKAGEIVALEDINLEIEAGEIFGIIGMSGAGKSTLVRCMNLLERPTEGRVVFDGMDLSGATQKQLSAARRSIGMIFQQFNLLMQRTALKNICFPLELMGTPRAQAEERARQLLQIVDLVDKEGAYPSELSGGQKQRVAIARALATNPKVLLCDEATSALDPNTTSAILALLRDISQKLGITIVIITHEMRVIERICQRVAIIDNSKIAECGKVEDIFAAPRTEAARRLFFPDGKRPSSFTGNRCIRITFDGRSSFEPVIANMILECKEAVNILFADTKDMGGSAMGQMVLQLPDDEIGYAKILAYLKEKRIPAQEVEYHG